MLITLLQVSQKTGVSVIPLAKNEFDFPVMNRDAYMLNPYVQVDYKNGSPAVTEPVETSTDSELQLFISHYAYPVFITDKSNTILAANHMATKVYGGRELAGRSLSHVLWAREKNHHTMEMAYFGRTWMIMTEEQMAWRGNDCKKIFLQEHPDLPDIELIESTRDMIAVMLHRFRSPMTGMQGYLDLLMGETETERDKKRIETLSNGMQQLNDMLDELENLYYSQTESSTESLYLQAVIKEVVEELTPEGSKRVFISDNDKLKPIPLSRNKLKKILCILLNNATEHTSGNQQGIHIELKSDRKIMVTNYGDPIPDFVRQRMFLPFMTNKAQNMGIGLTQAHLLARHLGATIIPANNCKEKGISFLILLPPNL